MIQNTENKWITTTVIITHNIFFSQMDFWIPFLHFFCIQNRPSKLWFILHSLYCIMNFCFSNKRISKHIKNNSCFFKTITNFFKKCFYICFLKIHQNSFYNNQNWFIVIQNCINPFIIKKRKIQKSIFFSFFQKFFS